MCGTAGTNYFEGRRPDECMLRNRMVIDRIDPLGRNIGHFDTSFHPIG